MRMKINNEIKHQAHSSTTNQRITTLAADWTIILLTS
jgi:hypothetical protein